MAGIRFTDEQVSLLRSNPWVKSATPKYVSFTKEFMEEFIDQHSKGLTRYEIFESHGCVVNVAFWIRFETRYYGDMANQMFYQLADAYKTLDPLEVQKFVVGCLSTAICFREHKPRSNNSNKAPVRKPWQELIDMGEAPQKVKLAKTVLTIKKRKLC